MNKIELLKALDEIKESYDAFYFANKSDDLTHCTHKEQFEKLSQVKGLSLKNGALSWIRYCYDCYYKYEFEDEKGSAFEYIRNLINKEEVRRMKKKITLTLNLEDTITVDENDDIDYVKDEMLYLMHDYVTHITFGAFCNECNIEIEELEDEN